MNGSCQSVFVLGVSALLLAVLAAGCGAPHFRHADSSSELREWEQQQCDATVVKRLSDTVRAPTATEQVVVRYSLPHFGAAFGDTSDGAAAGPSSAGNVERVVVGKIRTIRGPMPDHAGALRELRGEAAKLGATSLEDVAYTVVLGESFTGGAQLLGWEYRGTAVIASPAEASKLIVRQRRRGFRAWRVR